MNDVCGILVLTPFIYLMKGNMQWKAILALQFNIETLHLWFLASLFVPNSDRSTVAFNISCSESTLCLFNRVKNNMKVVNFETSTMPGIIMALVGTDSTWMYIGNFRILLVTFFPWKLLRKTKLWSWISSKVGWWF